MLCARGVTLIERSKIRSHFEAPVSGGCNIGVRKSSSNWKIALLVCSCELGQGQDVSAINVQQGRVLIKSAHDKSLFCGRGRKWVFAGRLLAFRYTCHVMKAV